MTTVSSGAPTTDAAIPQLRRLTCIPEAARLLDVVLRGQRHPWLARGEGPLDVQAVTVLRGHPGSRWTLRYTVRWGDEERALIAKVYVRDRGDVLATLTALRRLGFGPGGPLHVTAPLAYAPALAGDTRRLLAALVEARPAWPPLPHLAHGDFSASHVYLAAEATTVIDWDAWGVGDGAEDAGRFLASLRHLAARDPARREAVAREAEAFARTYQAAVPLAGRSLAFYEALACLRTATRLMANGSPRCGRRAAALLAAGERALLSD